MKTNYFTIIVLLYSLITNFVYSQNLDSAKYRRIESIYYDLDSNLIIVENDSTVFDGYLIFKFYKYKQNLYEYKNINGPITVESYWLNSLNEFNNTKKDYYMMSDYFFYSIYTSQGEGGHIFDTTESVLKHLKFLNSDEFKKFKRLYNKYYGYDIEESYKGIFLKYKTYTNIFDDTAVVFLNYGERDSIGYYIFKCSFSTAILRYKSLYWKGKDENGDIYEYIGFIKVLLPISPSYYFKPVGEEEFVWKGFKKSKWIPNILYKHY